VAQVPPTVRRQVTAYMDNFYSNKTAFDEEVRAGGPLRSLAAARCDACIGWLCLRRCVHGAPITTAGGAGARPPRRRPGLARAARRDGPPAQGGHVRQRHQVHPLPAGARAGSRGQPRCGRPPSLCVRVRAVSCGFVGLVSPPCISEDWAAPQTPRGASRRCAAEMLRPITYAHGESVTSEGEMG
jgi:hypothetical protein